MTASVRYGAKSAQVDREIQATTTPITTEVVTVVYETDPEIVAAVLPRPLIPGPEPLARVAIQQVSMDGRPPFGSAVFSVACQHDGVGGDYPLLMPQSTEQSLIGGRETFGEPKKLGEMTLERDGERIHAAVDRLGYRLAEVSGRVADPLDVPADPVENVEYYFKFLRRPEGDGITDPHLVECTYRRRYLEQARIDGTFTLGDSPVDPFADIEVRAIRSITWAQRQTQQTGRIVASVPDEWLLPFVHQRYDDMSLLAAPTTKTTATAAGS